VNSPTSIHVEVPAHPTEDNKSDWPDLILQCEWPTLANTPVAVPTLPGSHTVRNRPWTLLHPGHGAVYSVKIQDIDFSGYVAFFSPVDMLTDKPEAVYGQICQMPSRQIVVTHDLESLISHPPPSYDAGRYAVSGDEVEAQIPISVTYEDKNGNRFLVKYVLHYDCWFELGRMVRVGGIEKLN
jgi:hypothetical protein